MEIFFAYLIKSSILLAVSVLFFSLLMLKETFHTFNRFLLLAIMGSAFLLPAVNFGVDSPLSYWGKRINAFVGIVEDTPEILSYPTVETLVLYNSAVDTVSAVDVVVAKESLSAMEIVTIIYFFVLSLLLLRQLYMYAQVIMLLRNGKRINPTVCDTAGAKVLVCEKNIMPFSWFKRIVISENDLCECGREILAHEMAHVRKGHSYDIFLVDILIILQWFNPFAWMIKHFIKDIHEFEADDAVIRSGIDFKMYQLLIIKKAVGARFYSIANSFNHSLTKKRITMLCKKKSNLRHCMKALYLVPVVVVAACTFSSSDKEEVRGKVNENVVTIETPVAENVVDSIDEVLEVVNEPEIPAEYPGGAVALMKYLQRNIKYPKEAREQNIQGKSYVQFVVREDGCIDCVNVVRSSGSQLLDDEAVRIVKSLPRWSAAKHNGKEVNSQFTLPIYFKLMGSNTPTKKDEEKDSESFLPQMSVAAIAPDDGEIYQVVEEQPLFVGGTAALNDYLFQNIKVREEWYNDDSFKEDAFVSFIVNKDGSISDPKITISSGNKEYDKELLRVVAAMPKWNPGKMRGKPVRVRHNIAISQSSKHTGEKEQTKESEGEIKASLHFGESESLKNTQNRVNAAVIHDNNAGHPLYIVDGIYLDNYTDNTNNIESITVLPSDKALFLYGDRAKDGAIIITTKKGAVDSQKSKIKVDAIIKDGVINIAYTGGKNIVKKKKEYTLSDIPMEAFKYFEEVMCFVRLNVDSEGRTKAVSDQRMNIKYNYAEYGDEALELRGEYSRKFMEEAVRIVGDISPLDIVGENNPDGVDVIANVLFVCGL